MTGDYTLTHGPSGLVVAHVARLDGWWAKGQGVIGMAALAPGAGVWLPGVSAVHTLFVRFPLDLLFLDADFRTLRLLPDFPAWRPLARASGAHHTVELGAGTLARLSPTPQIGDAWLLRPVGEGPGDLAERTAPGGC